MEILELVEDLRTAFDRKKTPGRKPNRNLEVIELAQAGLSIKEIAEKLERSYHSVYPIASLFVTKSGRQKTAPHGSRSKYNSGCRCKDCTTSNAVYARQRRGESHEPLYTKEANQKRNDEIRRLRFDEKWSITKLGVYFGVSRQRIHQIIGRTGRIAENKLTTRKGSHYQQVKEAKDIIEEYSESTAKDIRKITGIPIGIISEARAGLRYYPSKGNSARGMKIEDYVSDVLRANCIENSTTLRSRPFDIILADGRTVEVKSRFMPSKSTKTENFYFFSIRNAEKPDFYILVVVDGNDKDVFVVPSEIVASTGVGFCWPATERSRGRITQYHNRFDLLKG